MSPTHIPVMLNEAIDALSIEDGQWYIDATLGGGGHASAIIAAGGNVLGIEQDHASLTRTSAQLSVFNDHFKPVLGRFGSIKSLATDNGLQNVSGILMDLGYSSDQLDDSSIGMSFQQDALLDMRLSGELGVSAADLVNGLVLSELVHLFQEYGEVDRARRIALAIVEYRKIQPIKTTGQLRKIIEDVYGGHWADRIHPATKVFQALRIAVNDELGQLEKGLIQSVELLNEQGRLVVIGFHSLEDRMVKRFMLNNHELTPVKPFPMMPSEDEIARNSRSRSAKMRVAIKQT
ncbi:16S rRNA (cytosine(1402)-N(4))-methyltransferase RsmH [candidate division WWE3 bacterium]|nr:16S rRNA (cytosine(1402)-N(4))-methyltransferase RsmH [candidate division WWE3 bacterium]